MKRFWACGIYIFFWSINVMGQLLPIWQSQSTSLSFQDQSPLSNCYFYTTENGAVFALPYMGGLAQLTNTGFKLIETNPLYNRFDGIYSINDSEYYLCNEHLIGKLSANGKISLLYNNVDMRFCQFTPCGNYYYLMGYNKDKELNLYSFDGKSLMNIKTIGKTGLLELLVTNRVVCDQSKQAYLNVVSENKNLIYPLINNRIDSSRVKTIEGISTLNLSGFLSPLKFQTKPYQLVMYNFSDYKLSYYFNGINKTEQFDKNEALINSYKNYYLQSKGIGNYQISEFDTLKSKATGVYFQCNTNALNFLKEPIRNSFMIGTGSKPIRVFPYLKKYPDLFGINNSSSVFSLRQDHKGRIWAGSYQGDLSIIGSDKVIKPKDRQYRFMNAGNLVAGRMYLLADLRKGLISYDESGNSKTVLPNHVGYCTYLNKSKTTLYVSGCSDIEDGLLYCNTNELSSGKAIHWHRLQKEQNFKASNVQCITEDTLGRIWASSAIMSIFNPKSQQTQNLDFKKGELPFHFSMSSFTDNYGTVWIGSYTDGLWYYNKYDSIIRKDDFKQVVHPFWLDKQHIMAIAQYRNQLLMSYGDKLLLLNLDSFYQKHKTIIRYLNPHEANFTSALEQNTLLVSARDSSVWFSTSDQVYQWGIAQWLRFKTYKAKPIVSIKAGEQLDTLRHSALFNLAPKNNSFQLKIDYHTPDLLPRYIHAWLRKDDGDSIKIPAPSLETEFTFSNLKSGHYTFVLNMLEDDGSISHYEYPIHISAFWFEQPKYWLFIAICLSSVIAYIIYLRSKKKIESMKLKSAEAKMAQWQAETESELNKLKIASISNQFKPHFLLNTLNAVGSFLYQKPQAERLVDLIGKSVGIIFAQSSSEANIHTLNKEWELIENVIEIFKILYIKELETIMPAKEELKEVQLLRVPFGILQIPVENSLLHGLHNRKTGPYLLTIKFENKTDKLQFIIEDNGVGREKSAQLSNVRKHGTGLRNLQETIRLFNLQNPENNISMSFEDNILQREDGPNYGTRLIIEIPKIFKYEF